MVTLRLDRERPPERGVPYRGGSLKSSNARNLSNAYAEYVESRPRRRMGDDGWNGAHDCEADGGTHAWVMRTAECAKCSKTLTEVHGH